MKIKRKILAIMSALMLITAFNSVTVLAQESDFNDGVYKYQATGYTSSASGTNTLVAKIDTYYYENNSSVRYCAADVYFSKRNSSGNTISTNNYGYAVAQFERNQTVIASSDRIYGYSNAVAWSGGTANILYSPHYYGTCVS